MFIVFMDLINRVFHEYLDKFIVVFKYDILVYSKSQEKYEQHLKFSLQRLKEKQLYAKLSKYEFWLDTVAFLGYIVSVEGISTESSKFVIVLD